MSEFASIAVHRPAQVVGGVGIVVGGRLAGFPKVTNTYSPGASVLEFDLRIENDVRGDQVGRQQNQTARVEAVLPLAIPGSHRLQC
jgi:hypothetical protein